MARSERGASAVEFAIVLPVLFLVMAGIVDFGRYFFTQIQVTNAAREGVRAAIMYPNPDAAAMADITTRATQAALSVPSLTVRPVTATCTPGSAANASVTVQASFTWIVMGPAIRLVGGTWGLSGPVSATGVMRCGG